MKPLDVLFLIYDLERGGPELRLLDLAEYFPLDIRMHICVLSENLSLLRSFQKAGCNVVVVPVSRPWLEPGKLWRIFRYVRLHHIGIMNSFDLKSLLISVIVRYLFRAKVTLVHHFVELLDDSNRMQRNILKVFLELVDFSIFNSENSRNSIWRTHFPVKKNVMIYNGVDATCFSRNKVQVNLLKERHSIATDDFVMGTIANFRAEKNYPFLFRAFALLSKRHSDLRLICVGGGYLFDVMKQMAKKYGIEQRVIFSGYSENIVEYLSLMNVFVLCSTREGLPNVLLQAMSMELPVVAADVGGCYEIIDHMTSGILYPSNDLDKFLEAVEMLMEDSSFASILGTNARRTVEKRFSLNRMIEEYTAFFRALSECEIDKSR